MSGAKCQGGHSSSKSRANGAFAWAVVIPTPDNANKPYALVPAELAKDLDSKKIKEGDTVFARMTIKLQTPGGTVIPMGSELRGHVTEVRTPSKGDKLSTLGIVFDKVILPHGKELLITGTIQALAPSLQADEFPSTAATRCWQGSGNNGPPVLPICKGKNPSKPIPVLTAESKGVFEIKDVQFGDHSVLTSAGKNITLDQGTQIIVKLEMR